MFKNTKIHIRLLKQLLNPVSVIWAALGLVGFYHTGIKCSLTNELCITISLFIEES